MVQEILEKYRSKRYWKGQLGAGIAVIIGLLYGCWVIAIIDKRSLIEVLRETIPLLIMLLLLIVVAPIFVIMMNKKNKSGSLKSK
jgi:TRAP-type C4-dicarboxylate transport system permease large subunit